jgi:hypothetical protein
MAVAAGRRSQAIADLDAAAIWLGLEADPPDGTPIGQAGDPVVAERSLLTELGGRAEEAPHCANVALEREIVRPRIGRSRTTCHDAFCLFDIDCVQLERDVRTSVTTSAKQRSSPSTTEFRRSGQ